MRAHARLRVWLLGLHVHLFQDARERCLVQGDEVEVRPVGAAAGPDELVVLMCIRKGCQSYRRAPSPRSRATDKGRKGSISGGELWNRCRRRHLELGEVGPEEELRRHQEPLAAELEPLREGDA